MCEEANSAAVVVILLLTWLLCRLLWACFCWCCQASKGSSTRVGHGAEAPLLQVVEVDNKREVMEEIDNLARSKGFAPTGEENGIFVEYIFQEYAADGCITVMLERSNRCTFPILLCLWMFCTLKYFYHHLEQCKDRAPSERSPSAYWSAKDLGAFVLNSFAPGTPQSAVLSLLLFVRSQTLSFGHSCVRYVLPSDYGGPEEVLADLRDVRDLPQGGTGSLGSGRGPQESLVKFYNDPANYFFDGERVNPTRVRGGMFSRSFCSIRVGPVRREKVLAMHHYFKSVNFAHEGNREEEDAILGYGFLGIVTAIYYFWRPDLRNQRRANCAQYISEGLFLAGLISRPQLFPKAIWANMFEQQFCPRILPDAWLSGGGRNTKNVFITYYKQKPPPSTRRLINSVVTPVQLYRNRYYRNLERFADVIVSLGGDNVAEWRRRERPTRPGCWHRPLLKGGDVVIPVICILWLAFGWPDDNFVRQRTFFAGLGARVLLGALLMSAYSLMH